MLALPTEERKGAWTRKATAENIKKIILKNVLILCDIEIELRICPLVAKTSKMGLNAPSFMTLRRLLSNLMTAPLFAYLAAKNKNQFQLKSSNCEFICCFLLGNDALSILSIRLLERSRFVTLAFSWFKPSALPMAVKLLFLTLKSTSDWNLLMPSGTFVSSLTLRSIVSIGRVESRLLTMVAARVSFSDVPRHEMVSVEPVGVVNEQRHGVIKYGAGHLQRIGLMAVRKGVAAASPQVGSPERVKMYDLYWLLVMIHDSPPQLAAEQSNGSDAKRDKRLIGKFSFKMTFFPLYIPSLLCWIKSPDSILSAVTLMKLLVTK